jgi:hypothetical protein
MPVKIPPARPVRQSCTPLAFSWRVTTAPIHDHRREKIDSPEALAVKLPTFEVILECLAGAIAGGLGEELLGEDLP